ncbi:MAG: nucleoside deaminase [Chloroflexota bacterium]
MWSDLPRPWQDCLELAWEAYCDDCIPIGAVVTGPGGDILTRGRNRIFEKVKPGGVNGSALAHAEVEALRGLDLDAVDPHACALYTTTEPCPMCMGAFYMSGLRTLHYAARDPWAGSVNLLGSTWYLARKPIQVSGPHELLEMLITGLFVEQDCTMHSGNLPEGDFYRRIGTVMPSAVEFGIKMWQIGEVKELRRAGVSAEEIFDRLAIRVK